MDSKFSKPDAWLKKVVALGITVALCLLAASLVPLPLGAQTLYGSIVGTVTDSTGAAIPRAAVTVTNLGTNEKKSVQTGAAGEYRFVDLVPANYKVEVQAKAFKKFLQSSVTVPLGTAIRVDATMQVGAADETVVVTTQAPLLQTDSGTVGSQVEGKVVQEMPLNGRNPMNLIALAPGVVAQGSSSGSASLNSSGSHTNTLGWSNFEIGGAISGYSVEYIDGAPINTLGGNAIALVPTQDAIQEFKISTNSVSAEFGRFAGGAIEMTTKSGANAFHASLYEYLRNTVLNANPFLTNYSGKPRAPFHQNQYGAVASGPIKKDKAFFFFSWENFNLRTKAPNPTNVPTQAQRNGIFSKAITDPSGKCAIQANTPQVGQYTIPTSCFDTTSAVILNYYPLPNSTNSTFNYSATPETGDDTRQFNARIDYNLSQKQRIFGRYTYWHLQDIAPDEFNGANGFPTGWGATGNLTHALVLGDTYTINPTTIFDARISWTRQYFWNLGPGINKVDMSQFGSAYAKMASEISFRELPNILTQGGDNLWNFQPMDSANNDYYDNYAIDASLTKIIGRHTLKMGGEVRLMDRTGNGSFTNAAGLATFKAAPVGDEIAALELGQFQNNNIKVVIPTTTFNYSQALYITDTWQVNRSLTLNLGLRWELPGGMEEKKDRTTVLLPSTVDTVTGDLGTVGLVNSSQYHSRSMEPFKHNLFGPRVGFSQRIDASSVARGGYGIAYISPDQTSGVMAYNSPVVAASTTSINTGIPTAFESNPFPTGILLPPGRTSSTWTGGLLNQAVSSALPTSKYPYMQQWNLSASRQWTGNWMTEVAYVGAKGTQLPSLGGYQSNFYNSWGLDELPSQYQSTLRSMEAAGATSAQLLAYGQAKRPFPQFQDYQNTSYYGSSTTYHTLQVTAAKRFATGGVLNANYTWAKMIGDTDSLHFTLETQASGMGDVGFIQDFNNPAAEKSLIAYDTRQRVVVNYVLDLPFGRGRKYLHDVKGVTSTVISGWSVNGITTFQAGFPMQFHYNGNYLMNNFGAGFLRPNYVAGCNKKGSGSAYQRFVNHNWFNAACFTYPGDFAFGNEPRNDPSMRLQGVDNFDFAVLKATKITERANLQFRAEFFNLFNHPQFGTPGNEMGGSNWDIITQQVNSPRLVQGSLRLNF